MKLSTKGQYAVMALAHIAAHGTDKPVSLAEISVRQNLPLPYLEQIFSKLRKKGIVSSSRGNLGGYCLEHAPESVNILDVFRAVGETIQTKRCTPDQDVGCQGRSERCLTHNLWEGLEGEIEKYLSSKNLADLCAENGFYERGGERACP